MLSVMEFNDYKLLILQKILSYAFQWHLTKNPEFRIVDMTIRGLRGTRAWAGSPAQIKGESLKTVTGSCHNAQVQPILGLDLDLVILQLGSVY